MESLLILGRIPAKKECPFIFRCQTWKKRECGRKGDETFACPIAQLFDIERTTTPDDEE